MKVTIDGLEPLVGKVRISGSKNASLKLIVASLFCNEDVVIDNVPRIENIESDLALIKALGAKVEWLSANKLVLNGSTISAYEVPLELGSKYRTSALLAGPLLYRFGNASIPKPTAGKIGPRPINRWIDTWDALGYELKEDDSYYHLKTKRLANAEINFKVSSVMGTENALFSSLFIPGETMITGAAAEPEVDQTIKFLTMIGANIKRVEERKIVVNGSQGFGGGKFIVMSDRTEVVTFVTAALATYGDIEIEGAVSGDILPFMRKLEAMKASFEFVGTTLRVWRSKNQVLESVNVETAPAPGFMTEWQSLIAVLLTQANGVGYIHETVYTDRFLYVKELNRMGAKITLLQPSQVGLEKKISDDNYDEAVLGEPYTVARIEGVTPLRREKISIPDLRSGAALVVAALAAEGRTDLFGFENVNAGFEHFDEKLKLLGAKLSTVA